MNKSHLKDYSHYTEENLFELIRKDDKKAFAELFNRYWRKAFNIGWSKLHDREATEEVVQELFILLWEKRASLSVHNFSSFLYTCVKNKCLNYIESLLIRKKHWEHYRTFIPETENATDKKVAYNELLEAIHVGLEDLPQKTKVVFQLNRLEGRSVSEIANTLNLSEKTIEYHLTRSLKQLRVHLKDFILLLAVMFY